MDNCWFTEKGVRNCGDEANTYYDNFFFNLNNGYFLYLCQSVKIIVLICDFLASADIKKEQQDQLMFPIGVEAIHWLAELEAMFLQTILKKLGHDDRLIIMAYKLMNAFLQGFN